MDPPGRKDVCPSFLRQKKTYRQQKIKETKNKWILWWGKIYASFLFIHREVKGSWRWSVFCCWTVCSLDKPLWDPETNQYGHHPDHPEHPSHPNQQDHPDLEPWQHLCKHFLSWLWIQKNCRCEKDFQVCCYVIAVGIFFKYKCQLWSPIRMALTI